MRYLYLKITIVSMILLIFLPGRSQMYYGLKTGLNYATIRGSSYPEAKGMVGYNYSGIFDVNLQDIFTNLDKEKWSFQTEFNVSQKGAIVDFKRYNMKTAEEGDFIYQEDVKLFISYITIPMLMKYSLNGPNALSSPYFYMGPYLGGVALLTIDGHRFRDHNNFDEDEFRAYKDDFSGVDYGLVAGIGYYYKLGGPKSKWELTGDLRYDYGMKKIGYKKVSKDLKGLIDDIKTNTVEFSIGIRMRIIRKDPFKK